MNSENVWIPWNERNDLKIMYFIYEYTIQYGIAYFRNKSFEQYIVCDSDRLDFDRSFFEEFPELKPKKYVLPSLFRRFICLEKMPDNNDIIDHFCHTFFKKFETYRKKEFGGCSGLILKSHCYIATADKLSSDERLLAHEYKEYVKNENSFLYQTVMEIRNSLEKFDKSESILNSSQTVNILASAPVADFPAVPADKDSPAENLTAKPKQKKATKKETQIAADLIIDYFRNGNHRKFSLLIINKHLEKELGQKFDLSAKTFLGKVYAVLYYQKKKIPPRSWTVGKVEEAEKEVQNKLRGK